MREGLPIDIGNTGHRDILTVHVSQPKDATGLAGP